jgi:hypothetical protein
MEITIESNIPIPFGKHHPDNRLPYDKMEVGQSFFVPLSVKQAGTVQVATVRANQKTASKEFRCSTANQTQQVTAEGQEPVVIRGTRVWRIA